MKDIIFFSLLIFSLQFSFAENCDKYNKNKLIKNVETLGTQVAIIANLSTDDNNVKYEAATTYLMSIQNTEKFDDAVANNFIVSITPICNNEKLEAKFRSKVCETLSEIHGRNADKLQSSGIPNGQKYFHYIKKALIIDPSNKDAAISHAMAVIEIYKENYIKRKITEKLLEIDGDQEAKAAKSELERLKLTNDPLYKEILDIF